MTAGVEIAQHQQPAIEFRPGSSQRFLGDAALMGDACGFVIQPLAPQRRFLQAGPCAFQLAHHVGVPAMRGLNAGLRAIAVRFGIRERLPNEAQTRLYVVRALLRHGDDGTERLQTMLTLNDTCVVICPVVHP